MYAASHKIPTENVEPLLAKVAKLNTRVVKARLTGDVTATPVHESFAGNRSYTWVTFVSSAAFKVEGWTFVARYDYERDVNHNQVVYLHAVPGVDVPADRRESDGRCDHCGSIRRRTNTFLLVNEAGEYKVVGRQCLADFFGTSAAKLASMFEWIRSPADICSDFEDMPPGVTPIRYTPNSTVLTVTAAVTSVAGWVSGAKAKESDNLTSTAGHVHTLLNPPGAHEHYKVIEAYRALVARFPVTDAHKADGQLIADLVAAAPADGEYIEKLQKVVAAGHVSERNFNVLVSAVTLLIKHRSICARAAESVNVPDIIEGRYEFTATVVSYREEQGFHYNQTVLKCLLRDAEGRKYWGTYPTSLVDPEVGATITLKATITRSDKDAKFGFFKRPVAVAA